MNAYKRVAVYIMLYATYKIHTSGYSLPKNRSLERFGKTATRVLAYIQTDYTCVLLINHVLLVQDCSRREEVVFLYNGPPEY